MAASMHDKIKQTTQMYLNNGIPQHNGYEYKLNPLKHKFTEHRNPLAGADARPFNLPGNDEQFNTQVFLGKGYYDPKSIVIDGTSNVLKLSAAEIAGNMNIQVNVGKSTAHCVTKGLLSSMTTNTVVLPPKETYKGELLLKRCRIPVDPIKGVIDPNYMVDVATQGNAVRDGVFVGVWDKCSPAFGNELAHSFAEYGSVTSLRQVTKLLKKYTDNGTKMPVVNHFDQIEQDSNWAVGAVTQYMRGKPVTSSSETSTTPLVDSVFLEMSVPSAGQFETPPNMDMVVGFCENFMPIGLYLYSKEKTLHHDPEVKDYSVIMCTRGYPFDAAQRYARDTNLEIMPIATHEKFDLLVPSDQFIDLDQEINMDNDDEKSRQYEVYLAIVRTSNRSLSFRYVKTKMTEMYVQNAIRQYLFLDSYDRYFVKRQRNTLDGYNQAIRFGATFRLGESKQQPQETLLGDFITFPDFIVGMSNEYHFFA